jgi:hypothetical protein
MELLMDHGQDVNQFLSLVKSYFPGDDVQPVQKSPSFPFGLASVVNNSFAGDTRVCWLRDGFIDDRYVVEKFLTMVKHVSGKKDLYIDPDGNDKWLKQRSRWNPDYDYAGAVGRTLSEQVKGLRYVSHLILTLDPKRIGLYMPHWWIWGEKAFAWIVVGFLVGQFLEGLNKYLRSINRPWSFIAWVIEPHESGFPHVHLMFLGNYIADLAVLVGLWPYSEPQGVRLGGRRKDGTFARGFQGKNLVRYLTVYLSKDIQSFAAAYNRKLAKGEKLSLGEKDRIRIAAFVHFFRRRLFNCRHLVTNEDGSKIWLFAQKLKSEGRWKKVPHNRKGESAGLGDDEIDPVEYDLMLDGADPPGIVGSAKWSGNLSTDLKRISSMPVLYPEQINENKRGGC